MLQIYTIGRLHKIWYPEPFANGWFINSINNYRVFMCQEPQSTMIKKDTISACMEFKSNIDTDIIVSRNLV